MRLYHVSNNYIKYLYAYDTRVPLEHGNNRRPYIGSVIRLEGEDYFVPLTSKMRNNGPGYLRVSESRN